MSMDNPENGDSHGEWDEDRTTRMSPEALKKEALSARHLLCHRPFNHYCAICRAMRARRRRHKRKLVPLWTGLTKFGEMVTGDHIVAQPTPAERVLADGADGKSGILASGGEIPRPGLEDEVQGQVQRKKRLVKE